MPLGIFLGFCLSFFINGNENVYFLFLKKKIKKKKKWEWAIMIQLLLLIPSLLAFLFIQSRSLEISMVK